MTKTLFDGGDRMQGGVGTKKLLPVIGSDCGNGYTVHANVIFVKLHTLNMCSFSVSIISQYSS